MKRKDTDQEKDSTWSAKRTRLISKRTQYQKPTRPQLPRPKQPLIFTLPKHVLQTQSTTPISISSTKEQAIRSRSSTPSTSPREPPLLSLHRLTILLTAIHRRNKNQHRNQPFYRHLSFLRRSIKKLIDLYEQSATLASHSSSTSTRMATTANTAAIIRQRFEHESQLRSHRDILEEHIREIVVPNAYVAFSGVVTDTQFANLGIVLLGVLADVTGVCGVMRRIEKVDQLVTKREVKDSGRNVGGSLVGLSTLVTGPEQGVVMERIYDSDGGTAVGEKRRVERSTRRGIGTEDVDMGELVPRDEDNDLSRGLGRGKDAQLEEGIKQKTRQPENTPGHGDEMNTFDTNVEGYSTLQAITNKTDDSPVTPRNTTPATLPTPQHREPKPAPALSQAFSKQLAPSKSESTSTISKTTHPSKSLKGNTEASPDTVQRELSTSKAKTRTKGAENAQRQSTDRRTKSKKKANAIDDLFSGFG